ncbi:hypothetical protein RRG08_041919 [Elysia crispata]|uniref:NIPSNAP domain-containing protein n=1 Tax=Elysia crispata TaxID=231223 RepID=A0AAE0XWV9_9GAST|nr:hypothetical protein RRG08_041919 [Elysia crispata]
MCTKLLTPFTYAFIRGHASNVRPNFTCLKQRKLHTTETSSPSLYELRSYQTEPKDLRLLLIFSLIGFWTAEIGDALWQVVHLWEYANLQERAGVRKALAQDKAWASEFLSQAMPKMKLMKNHLVMPAPTTKLDLNFANDANAVYVLQTVQDADKFTSMSKSATGDEKLIGRFITLLGSGNTEFRL